MSHAVDYREVHVVDQIGRSLSQRRTHHHIADIDANHLSVGKAPCEHQCACSRSGSNVENTAGRYVEAFAGTIERSEVVRRVGFDCLVPSPGHAIPQATRGAAEKGPKPRCADDQS